MFVLVSKQRRPDVHAQNCYVSTVFIETQVWMGKQGEDIATLNCNFEQNQCTNDKDQIQLVKQH